MGLNLYEMGLDSGLLQVSGRPPTSWNGLVSISEENAPTNTRSIYQDGIKVFHYTTSSLYEASLSAYTYPDDLDDVFDGALQNLVNLSYKTKIGDVGYRIHLLYDVAFFEDDRQYSTISEKVSPSLFAWKIRSTSRRDLKGLAQPSHFIVDSTIVDPEVLKNLESILYGKDDRDPRFPEHEELLFLFGGLPALEIIPDISRGLARIESDNFSDLTGEFSIGLFRRPPGSRLNNVGLPPGLNKLE